MVFLNQSSTIEIVWILKEKQIKMMLNKEGTEKGGKFVGDDIKAPLQNIQIPSANGGRHDLTYF